MKDYRQILKESLSKRISANPKYSLRAFARDLSISSGQLSLVMKGKKGISPERALQIFSKLGLNADEKRIYALQVSKEHARSSVHKKKASEALLSAQNESSFQLTQDAFEVIADWYHFAILQALSLKDICQIKTSALQMKRICEKLRISAIEGETAIERLIRLELIEVHNGRIQICHDTVFSTDGVPSAALRSFHAQVLKKASDALELQTLEERYPNTIMLPILKKDFISIKSEMVAFQKKIMRKYGRAVQGDGERVYALTTQLFKLTEDL